MVEKHFVVIRSVDGWCGIFVSGKTGREIEWL